MTNIVNIRVWTQNDLEVIRKITWETWLATYAKFIPEEDLRSYFDTNYTPDVLRKLYHSVFMKGFLAEVDGITAGCMRTFLNKEENRFYVSSLYILPQFQGKGIGSRLMAEAEECARGYHLDQVWLGVMEQNIHALEWYKAQGFEFPEEAPFIMGKTSVNHFIGFKRIHSNTSPQ
jgi:ribosomal protein S18 acetylase RimI-like enzyme